MEKKVNLQLRFYLKKTDYYKFTIMYQLYIKNSPMVAMRLTKEQHITSPTIGEQLCK